MIKRMTMRGIKKILETSSSITKGAILSENKRFVTNGWFMLPNKFTDMDLKVCDYKKVKNDLLKHLFEFRKSATTVYTFYKEIGDFYVYKNGTVDDIRVFKKQFINAMFCALRQDGIENLKKIIIKAQRTQPTKQCYFMGYPIMPIKARDIKDIPKGE